MQNFILIGVEQNPESILETLVVRGGNIPWLGHQSITNHHAHTVHTHSQLGHIANHLPLAVFFLKVGRNQRAKEETQLDMAISHQIPNIPLFLVLIKDAQLEVS